jgi:hypothetical protein
LVPDPARIRCQARAGIRPAASAAVTVRPEPVVTVWLADRGSSDCLVLVVSHKPITIAAAAPLRGPLTCASNPTVTNYSCRNRKGKCGAGGTRYCPFGIKMVARKGTG